VAWFVSQKLISRRAPVGEGVVDAVHQWTAGIHAWFLARPAAANALLIVSSAGIDAVGVWMLGAAIFGPTLRPFAGLLVLFVLRQAAQSSTALPAPPGMIWRYTGFPSMLVTYAVANDFFFSGHTAIAVYGGMQLAHLGGPWIWVGCALAAFEAITVLVLRAHYTMDVFTGILAALLVGAWFW
jgi:hypothetical protein